MDIGVIKEGFSIFLTRFKPYPKYKGTAKDICKTITKKCFNGKFFQTGADSYPQFWTRDFGFCTNSLLHLGYKKEVKKTLEFALTHFKKHNKVACYLSRNNIPLDFPTYAVDSLPLLLHSIRLSKLNIKPYKQFLNEQIKIFKTKVLNKKTGLVKPNTHFSSMKDHSIRNSSCYDNCMLYLLQQETTKLKLHNPIKHHNYKRLIKKHFWNNFYFEEDLTNAELTGDSNIFPFWTNLFKDRKMFNSCLKHIQADNLDQPWPLKYTKVNHFGDLKTSILVPYWEGDKIWSFLGLYFIETVAKFNKPLAKTYLRQYKYHIEKNKNFYELFNKNQTPYKSLFYKADHSMLWACKYLHLKRTLKL